MAPNRTTIVLMMIRVAALELPTKKSTGVFDL
jgi:hypothetical protein